MKARRQIGAVVAAAAVALALPAIPASGDGGAKSRIKLKKLNAAGAVGKVSSGKASCLAKRKVSVFAYEGFITDKRGITYTNSKGKWRIKRRLKEGVYFAKVDASKGCRYDVSRRKRLTIG